LRRRISIACCLVSKLASLFTSDCGATGRVHPDNAVAARVQIHNHADMYWSFWRNHYPQMLASRLAGQHDVRSERLGHPDHERKTLIGISRC
jgi:hypothetical protein